MKRVVAAATDKTTFQKLYKDAEEIADSFLNFSMQLHV